VGGGCSAQRARELEPRHTPQRTRYQQHNADGFTNRTQGSGKLLNGGRATQVGAQEEKSTRKKKGSAQRRRDAGPHGRQVRLAGEGTIHARVSNGRYGVAPSSRSRASAGGATHEAGGGGWGGGAAEGRRRRRRRRRRQAQRDPGTDCRAGPPPPRATGAGGREPLATHTERGQHPTAPAAERAISEAWRGGPRGTLPTATWLGRVGAPFKMRGGGTLL